MVSMIDALFILPAAFFAVAFIVPAIILSTDSATEFRQTTSLGMSDTVAQSMTSAFLNTEKNNGLTNYKAVSYVMSGNGTSINRGLLITPPDMFSYLRFTFDSPYDSDSINCDNIPGVTSPKGGALTDDSCDFFLEPVPGEAQGKEKRYFRTKVPVRGGKVGVIDVAYEVK